MMITWYDRIVDEWRELSWASKRISRTPVVNKRGFLVVRSGEGVDQWGRNDRAQTLRIWALDRLGSYWAC